MNECPTISTMNWTILTVVKECYYKHLIYNDSVDESEIFEICGYRLENKTQLCVPSFENVTGNFRSSIYNFEKNYKYIWNSQTLIPFYQDTANEYVVYEDDTPIHYVTFTYINLTLQLVKNIKPNVWTSNHQYLYLSSKHNCCFKDYYKHLLTRFIENNSKWTNCKTEKNYNTIFIVVFTVVIILVIMLFIAFFGFYVLKIKTRTSSNTSHIERSCREDQFNNTNEYAEVEDNDEPIQDLSANVEQQAPIYDYVYSNTRVFNFNFI